MQEELESDGSETIEEVETPETTETLEEVQSKNRQLYERLKKEQAEKKALEERLKGTVSDDTFEDDVAKQKLEELENKIKSIEEKAKFDALFTKHPILEEKKTEFDVYRLEHPGMELEICAKSFLVEHDLYSQTPKRKGLEKAGGGQRTPPSPKMTADDAKRLRENNYAEYRKQLVAGKIQV